MNPTQAIDQSNRRLSHCVTQCLSLLAMFCIVGCDAPPTRSTGVARPGKLRLRFVYWGSPEVDSIYREIIHRFEQKHPDIDIRPDLINQGYEMKLMTEMAGGVGPDVITTEIEFFKRIVQRGVLADLTPRMRAATDVTAADFQPLVLNEFSREGQVYSVPFGVGTYALYYNKDLFDAAGLPYPPTSWQADDWTWDQFLTVCQKLTRDTDGDGRPNQYGVVLGREFFDAEMWLYQNGGALMSDDGRRCQIDTPASAEALQFLIDLALKHHVAPTPSQTAQGGSSSDQLFKMGRAALYPSGYWRIGEFEKLKRLHYGIAPFPMRKQKATGWHASGLSIWTGSKHPEAAWQFISYCASAEAQLMCARTGLQVPARLSVANSSAFLTMAHMPSNVALFNEGFAYAHRLPGVLGDRKMLDTINQKLDLAWNGLDPVPTVCREIAWIINNQIGAQ
jgi:multiple sugar transport system substrate-binding protein